MANYNSSSARPAAGFTLVELMVTIVIASVLLAIAVPAYNSQIREARRTDAKTALLDFASREERFFSTGNAYTTDPVALGYTAFPQVVGSGYYQLATPNMNPGTAVAGAVPTPPTFDITATSLGTQTKDTNCASFKITSAGQQSSLNSGGADSTATCWK